MGEAAEDIPSPEENARRLAWFDEYTSRLDSQPPALPLQCPCCGCRTLGERGGFEICRCAFGRATARMTTTSMSSGAAPTGRSAWPRREPTTCGVGRAKRAWWATSGRPARMSCPASKGTPNQALHRTRPSDWSEARSLATFIGLGCPWRRAGELDRSATKRDCHVSRSWSSCQAEIRWSQNDGRGNLP